MDTTEFAPFTRDVLPAILATARNHLSPGRLDLRVTLRFVDGAWQCDVADGAEGITLPAIAPAQPEQAGEVALARYQFDDRDRLNPDPSGEWVTYESTAALRSQVTKLTAERDGAKKMIASKTALILELMRERDESRAKAAALTLDKETLRVCMDEARRMQAVAETTTDKQNAELERLKGEMAKVDVKAEAR